MLTRRCFRDLQPKDAEVHLGQFSKWLAEQDDIMQYLQQFINARFVTGLQDELKLAVTNANHSFNILASDESNTVTRKQFFSILEESNYEATDSEKREVIDIIQANGGLLDGDLDQIVENAFRAV